MSENMNNYVKEELTRKPSTPIVHPEQASASKPSTIGGNSSNQLCNEDNVEGQVTSIRSRKVFVSKRWKQRNIGTDATVVNSPDWLPKGWIIELKYCETGSTAWTRVKYYVDPVSGHRFRFKPDVLRYLHTGEITKKQRYKLLGNGINESQRFTLPFADALNMQEPNINSCFKVLSNLKIEINLVSVPAHAQKDVDKLTCLQNRKPYILTSNGLKAEVRQPLEVTKAAAQDLLPEEKKRKTLNTESKMDMKRKYHAVLGDRLYG